MPCTDTSDLAETLVRLPRQLLGAPAVGHTLEAMTLRDGDDVDTLVLLEDRADLHLSSKPALRDVAFLFMPRFRTCKDGVHSLCRRSHLNDN